MKSYATFFIRRKKKNIFAIWNFSFQNPFVACLDFQGNCISRRRRWRHRYLKVYAMLLNLVFIFYRLHFTQSFYSIDTFETNNFVSFSHSVVHLCVCRRNIFTEFFIECCYLLQKIKNQHKYLGQQLLVHRVSV